MAASKDTGYDIVGRTSRRMLGRATGWLSTFLEAECCTHTLSHIVTSSNGSYSHNAFHILHFHLVTHTLTHFTHPFSHITDTLPYIVTHIPLVISIPRLPHILLHTYNVSHCYTVTHTFSQTLTLVYSQCYTIVRIL